MKNEEKKPFIQCCILGAIGGILMAAGDWLLGCVPLQKTDTGMFNRSCYLSGSMGCGGLCLPLDWERLEAFSTPSW